MPTADVSVTDSAVEITSGLYDTDDGFKAKVAGDEFWRVVISPQGVISVGDGTEAPAPIPTTSSFGFVGYEVAAGSYTSPGGDITTNPEDGVGPWVHLPINPTEGYGDPAVASVIDGMIHYPEEGAYWVSVQLLVDDTGVPGAGFDGLVPVGTNAATTPGMLIAQKFVLGSPASPDNELLFGTTAAGVDFLGGGVQIVRIA